MPHSHSCVKVSFEVASSTSDTTSSPPPPKHAATSPMGGKFCHKTRRFPPNMTTVQDPEMLFRKLAQQIESNGLLTQRRADLVQLESVRTLLNAGADASGRRLPASGHCNAQLITAILTGVVAVTVAVLYHWELYTARGFASVWLAWHKRDLYTEQCAIDMPNAVQDIFRPPVNCSMCESVFGVDRVFNVSLEEFKERYAYTGRPVVITDATQNWTALENFSFDFFKTLYGEDSPALENFRYSCQFFPYQTEFHSLREVFHMSLERSRLQDGSKPWYVGWSNCDSAITNILRKYYDRPYFLPPDSESSKTDWIFMGSPGYGAHMHIDHVGHPSWQAQISGQKKWTLVPPPECAHACKKIDVTVQPGEIIVLDTNIWFHQTLIVGDDMSITIGSEYD